MTYSLSKDLLILGDSLLGYWILHGSTLLPYKVKEVDYHASEGRGSHQIYSAFSQCGRFAAVTKEGAVQQDIPTNFN